MLIQSLEKNELVGYRTNMALCLKVGVPGSGELGSPVLPGSYFQWTKGNGLLGVTRNTISNKKWKS